MLKELPVKVGVRKSMISERRLTRRVEKGVTTNGSRAPIECTAFDKEEPDKVEKSGDSTPSLIPPPQSRHRRRVRLRRSVLTTL